MYDLKELDHDTAAASIETYAREGRLVQAKWHKPGKSAGHDFACLLGAIHPGIGSVRDCPAALMPRWMANLTVRLFDGIPAARIQEFGLAYAERLHRWRVLDAAGWERVRTGLIGEVMDGVIVRATARIGDAKPAGWPAIQDVHARLKALLLARSEDWSAYARLRDEARGLRNAAWDAWRDAQRRAAAAEAAAEAEAVAVAAAAVAAAVVEAAAAAVVAVAARRASYAQYFETVLRCIDLEIAAA